ncbi:MAG: hypothetical protein AAFV07_14145, partial [Bacteroidota bacterium]
MNPATNSFFPLAEFLVYLRNEDFPVGVDTYMRVQKVLDYLPAQLGRDQLKQVLCPIFARSETDQRRFYRLFDAYFAREEEALFTAVKGDIAEAVEDTKPSRLDWNWVRKYSRFTFILLTLLITGTFIYIPLRVYWAIKGSDSVESAPAYLERYGFADSDRYNYEVAKYIIRDLLVIDQPCDDLEGAGFSYQLLPVDSNTYKVGFQSYPQPVDGWPSIQWTFPNNVGLSEVSSPIYAFPDTGRYVVNLSFRNAYGCVSEAGRSIEVQPASVCDARFSHIVSADDPLKVQFSDTSLTEAMDQVIDRQWTVSGFDSLNQYKINPEIQFPEYGTYQVCLRIETQAGCISQTCEEIALENQNVLMTLVPIQPKPFVAIKRPEKRSPYLIFLLLGGAILILVGGFFHDIYKRLNRRAALQKERNAEGPFYNELTLDFKTSLYPEEQIFGAAR